MNTSTTEPSSLVAATSGVLVFTLPPAGPVMTGSLGVFGGLAALGTEERSRVTECGQR